MTNKRTSNIKGEIQGAFNCSGKSVTSAQDDGMYGARRLHEDFSKG